MITKALLAVIAVLAVALISTGIYAAWEKHEASKYEVAVSTYQSAQATNLSTISTLEKTAANTQSELQAKTKLAAQYAAAAHAAVDRANAALAQRTKSREVIYATPTIAPWANTATPAPVLTGLCRGTCGANTYGQ